MSIKDKVFYIGIGQGGGNLAQGLEGISYTSY